MHAACLQVCDELCSATLRPTRHDAKHAGRGQAQGAA